jgi:DNA polymerase-3 subunit alpha
MRFIKGQIIIHGLCTGIRKLTTKKNEVMAVATLEDLSGKIEVVLFPKTYTAFQPFLQEDNFMKAEGKADKRNGEWQMIAESIISKDLEKAREEAKKEGLFNEKEQVTNVTELENEEVSLQDENQASEESVVEGVEADTPEGARYALHLPDDFSREQMLKLNHLLSANEGDEEVELHFHEQHLIFPLKVTVTDKLKKEVTELIKN